MDSLGSIVRAIGEAGAASVLLAILIVENLLLARAFIRRDLILGWVWREERAARLKSDVQSKRSAKRVEDLTVSATDYIALRKAVEALGRRADARDKDVGHREP